MKKASKPTAFSHDEVDEDATDVTELSSAALLDRMRTRAGMGTKQQSEMYQELLERMRAFIESKGSKVCVCVCVCVFAGGEGGGGALLVCVLRVRVSGSGVAGLTFATRPGK